MTQDEKHAYLVHFMKHVVDNRVKRKASEEVLVKQHKTTRDNLRKNELRLEREKRKQSPHNQRYIENILKLLYVVEDSYELYNFLGVDMKEVTILTSLITEFFVQNPDLTAKALEG